MWDVSRAMTVLLFTSEPTWIAMLPSAFYGEQCYGEAGSVSDHSRRKPVINRHTRHLCIFEMFTAAFSSRWVTLVDTAIVLSGCRNDSENRSSALALQSAQFNKRY